MLYLFQLFYLSIELFLKERVQKTEDNIRRVKENKNLPIELKTILSNRKYHYIVKFNELKEISNDIPEIGDLLVGTINGKIEDYGVFVDIIKVDQVGSYQYSISGLLHQSNMDKDSPLRNWHKYYRNTYNFTQNIFVIIESITEKRCSLIEVSRSSGENYNTVRNSNDLMTMSLFETEEITSKIGVDLSSKYFDSRKMFYKKELKSEIIVSYSKKYNSFIYKDTLLIPMGCGNTYATKDFKKVFVISYDKESSKINKILYTNNVKNTKILFERKDLITEYNKNEDASFLSFEKRQKEYKEYILLKKEEEKQLYKKVLATQPIKIIDMYLIGEYFHTKGSDNPREFDSSTTYRRYSSDKFVREIKIYIDENKEYVYINNKLKEIDNDNIELINNNLLCIGKYTDDYNAFYIKVGTEFDKTIKRFWHLNSILKLEPNTSS